MRAAHLAAPRRTSPGTSAGTPTALAAAAVTAASTIVVLATRHDAQAVSLPEDRAPAVAVLLFVIALNVGALGCWACSAARGAVPAGLAVAVVGASLPFLSGWTALPVGIRTAVVTATLLTGAGLTHAAVGLGATGWGARAAYGCAGTALLVRLTTYNPFRDPSCWRICRDVGPLLPSPLPASVTYTLSATLGIAACLVG